MPEYISPSDDAYAGSQGTSLDDARNGSGTTLSIQNSDFLFAGVFNLSGFSLFFNYRTLMIFDLSPYVGQTVLTAKLKLYAYVQSGAGTLQNNSHKCYIVGTNLGGSLTSADYNNVTDKTSDGTYASDVPTYSSEQTIDADDADPLLITLNSTAISAINSATAAGGDFDLGILSHYDYLDDFSLTPSLISSFTFQGVSFYSHNYSTSGQRPLLELTFAEPGPITTATIKAGNITIKGAQITIK
jgi:hypothetical protein